MKKIWEKNWVYDVLKFYTDWTTRKCFRRFKVEGEENLLRDKPMIYAPNHCCTLLDAHVVLLADRHHPTSFGARADIFKSKLIYPILHTLRMVPLARMRDGLSEVEKNYATFDEIIDCIGHRVPFCMFVEGTHRPERGLQPIKNGIFKLARLAEEKLGEDVYIVPVGLAYEDFFNYMGDVTIRYGKPFTMKEYEGENLREVLGGKILELIQDYPVRKEMPLALSIPLAILSLPLFVLSFAFCWPMVLAAAIIIPKLKDKAWSNTARDATYYASAPIFFIALAVVMFITTPWWVALLSLAFFVVAHGLFYLLLYFYKRIIRKIGK